jgi:hypothetical protein
MGFILLLISFNESAMCNKNLGEISNSLRHATKTLYPKFTPNGFKPFINPL